MPGRNKPYGAAKHAISWQKMTDTAMWGLGF